MRLGSRAKLTIGIGVVAACGFAYLGLRELSGSADAAPQVSRQVRAETDRQVLLAASTRAIRTGETITADMIKNSISDPGRFPMAATPAEVIGKVAMRDIPANTMIARDALDRETKLAIRVPAGMRAISIDTTAEIAVAGLLRPGDRVDVQVVYPGADAINGARGIGRSRAQTLLQTVQILAVGDTVMGTQPPADDGGLSLSSTDTSSSSSSAATPAVARTVTLALFPDQVSVLSLAKSTGALYLSLRNPSDSAQLQMGQAVSTGPLPERQAPTPAAAYAPPPAILAQQLRAATAAQAAATARPRQAPHAIDLVVGGNHEVIYSGNGSR